MLGRDEYIRKLLDAYRTTPGTIGLVRRGDRMLAEQLYEGAVPLTVVLNALVLAAARRLSRAADAPPLPPIRSLAYFVAIIDEVLQTEAGQDYYDHLRNSLPPLTPR